VGAHVFIALKTQKKPISARKRSHRDFFLKINPYDKGVFVASCLFPVLRETRVSGDSFIKRRTAIAVENAGVLSNQKDHLQALKKVEIMGEKIKPAVAPILAPVTYRVIAVPLRFVENQRNTLAAAGAKIQPAARPHRVR